MFTVQEPLGTFFSGLLFLSAWCDYHLYENTLVHKRMLSNLGHCCLQIYANPACPILFNSTYLVSSLHKLIIYKLGQCALLRCSHPLSPISFRPKFLTFPYICWLFISWASVPYSGMKILHHLFYSILKYYLSSLPRKIICKFGQYALLKCKHPWAPIRLSTKYLIFLT